MNELRAALKWRASAIEPDPDAYHQLLLAVRRRRQRRRALAVAMSVSVIAAGLAAASLMARGPGRAGPALAELSGTRPAMALRAKLGIHGATKGAPPAVVVPGRTRTGAVKLSLIDVPSGTKIPLPAGAGGSSASVSPKGDVVAAVNGDQLVLTPTGHGRGGTPLVVSDTTGTAGSVSWDRGGNGLLAQVGGRWVRLSDFGGTSPPSVQNLDVPSIPGGPTLLSVSPGGNLVLLFGVTHDSPGTTQPHLYVGGFDGTTVSDIRPVEVPDQAVAGPLGWVGDNAFIVSGGPGQATVIRTDDGSITIHAEPVVDPCTLVSRTNGCTPDGPWLMGTSGDGSLLFWEVSTVASRQGSETDSASEGASCFSRPAAVGGETTLGQPQLVILYYKTWLDGTHAVRLTGDLSRYGPPCAAR